MERSTLLERRLRWRAQKRAHDSVATGAQVSVNGGTVERARADIHQVSPQEVLTLQRLMGNQAVNALLTQPSSSPAPTPPVQRALRVGAAHDPLEQEADRVAGQLTASAPMPKVGLEGGKVDQSLARKIDGAKQGGMPLSPQIRRTVEPALGADFSNVRVYNHAKSHDVNRALGAKAATHGNHILLGRGQSPHDTRLMAHELTHVVQQTQTGTADAGVVQRAIMSVEDWKTFSTVGGKNGKDVRRSGKLKAVDKALAKWHNDKDDPDKRVQAASNLKEKVLAWQYSKTDKSGNIKSQRKVEVEFLLQEIDNEIGSMPLRDRLQANYGVKLDNQAGVDAIKGSYKEASDDVKQGLTTKDWSDDELTGLEGALSNYKGMLGPARRAKGIKSQPIKTFSRLRQGIDIDDNTGDYALDTTTAGETFSKNISMFDAGTDIRDFASDKSAPTPEELRKGWQGTIEHELSHALVEKQNIGKFVKAMDFWSSRYRAAYDSRDDARSDGVEPPPTDYGASNANEDLAESLMFYFQDPTTLSTSYPDRYRFIQENVAPALR